MAIVIDGPEPDHRNMIGGHRVGDRRETVKIGLAGEIGDRCRKFPLWLERGV